jgi:hypothetical protein
LTNQIKSWLNFFVLVIFLFPDKKIKKNLKKGLEILTQDLDKTWTRLGQDLAKTCQSKTAKLRLVKNLVKTWPRLGC